MIKNIYIICSILALLLVFSACSRDESGNSFSIKGRLSDVDAPYFFIAVEEDEQIKIDTVFVDEQGAFSYKGKTDHLIMASLYFDKKSWSTSIFLDKGWNVEIKGNADRPDLIKVNGGNVNDDLTLFKKKNSDLFGAKADILQSIASLDKGEVLQNKDAELKNIDFELTNRVRTYVESNPGKIASVVLIQDFFKNEAFLETLDKSLDLLTGDALRFPLTKELRKYSEMLKQSKIGAIAPAINLKNGNKSLNLDTFKGKYIYLTFISHDSTIYTTEIPAMMKAYVDLKSKNIEFVSVIIDAPEKSTPPDSIKWHIYYDQHSWASDVFKNYNITEVPYGVLISPEGYIVGRKIYPAILSLKLDEVLAAKQ